MKTLSFFILRILLSFHQEDELKHDVHFSSVLKQYFNNTSLSMRFHSLVFYLFFHKMFLVKQMSAYSSLHFGFSQNSNSKLQSKPSPQPLLLYNFDQSHGNSWFHPAIMNWSRFHLRSSSEELTYPSGLQGSRCLHLTREHPLIAKLSSNWNASMQHSPYPLYVGGTNVSPSSSSLPTFSKRLSFRKLLLSVS